MGCFVIVIKTFPAEVLAKSFLTKVSVSSYAEQVVPSWLSPWFAVMRTFAAWCMNSHNAGQNTISLHLHLCPLNGCHVSGC